MIDRRTMLGSLLAAGVAACSSPRSANAKVLTVYKSPHCGCCTAWVDHVRANGFEAAVFETELVADTADELGVPKDVRSCHTAEIGGYFIEGHVPARDIRRLLQEQPNARGLAVPGMPIGSPGMEQGDQREPFATLLVEEDGSTRIFARHNRSATTTAQAEEQPTS